MRSVLSPNLATVAPRNDLSAQSHALVADEDFGPGDNLVHVLLVFCAETAPNQVVFLHQL